jgi:uncharacterized lipoprotein YddW (UPF0748 family)
MLGAFLFLTLAQQELPTPPPAPKSEFRAVWVATVDNIDWPSKRGIGTDQAKSELIRIFDKCRELNLNAVIFQVRPSADALYDSKIEPWSEYLTGQQGTAPNPYWDPLAFAVEEAHKRGIELHCWFNPYRALHPAQKGPVASNHFSKTNPGVVKQYGKYLWMDPGEAAVQRRSLDVMIDVVKRYDVDGVHIDDYFYPYKEKGPDGNLLDFPDENSYGRYLSAGGKLNKGDWRRKNVDDFIERLYSQIKRTKKWVKFGISPFGIYRPGVPDGIKAGVDQYADLYADALKWYQKGWCDYFTPQLYWPIKQIPQSYPVLLKYWATNNPSARHFWPGNFTSRTSPSEGNWPSQELVDQINLTRGQAGAGGNVHFSMKAFMEDYNGIATALKQGPYKDPALVPASPWLGNRKPGVPSLYLNQIGDNLANGGPAPVRRSRFWKLEWRMEPDSDAKFYATCFGVITNGKLSWSKWKVSSNPNASVNQGPSEPYRYVAIRAVSNTGVLGDPVVVERPN